MIEVFEKLQKTKLTNQTNKRKIKTQLLMGQTLWNENLEHLTR